MKSGWELLELARLVVAVMRAVDGRMVSRGVRSCCGWSPMLCGDIMLKMTDLEELVAGPQAMGDSEKTVEGLDEEEGEVEEVSVGGLRAEEPRAQRGMLGVQENGGEAMCVVTDETVAVGKEVS